MVRVQVISRAPPLGGTSGQVPGGGGNGGEALSQPGSPGARGVVVVSFDYVSDNVSATDNRLILVNFKRSFNETAFANDTIAKKFVTPESDSVQALDARVIKPILNRSESISVQDALVKAIKLSRLENIVVSDSILIVLLFLRYYGDVATASEQLSKNIGSSKSDSVAAVESVFKLFYKSATVETVSVNDNTIVNAQYSRIFQDAATATDALFKKVSLSFSDNISGAVLAAPTRGRKIFMIGD